MLIYINCFAVESHVLLDVISLLPSDESSEKILGAEIGEVFVHRNIANQVNPLDMSMIAAIDFAVNYLKIENIVIAGHSNCGGIRAAASN